LLGLPRIESGVSTNLQERTDAAFVGWADSGLGPGEAQQLSSRWHVDGAAPLVGLRYAQRQPTRAHGRRLCRLGWFRNLFREKPNGRVVARS